MQDKANGDSEEKSAGELSDQHVQEPEDEKKAVQRRTFTRWINVFLQRRDPPVEVHNLFMDIQDGRVLMALLEELSGCKLLYRFRASSHRIFRLNNISKALAFLDDRHVKLAGIDASGIADGVPSVVLKLIWNIILYFQVKEVTGGLQRHLSSSLSSLSMGGYPSPCDLAPRPNDFGSHSCIALPSKGRKAARGAKYHGKAIKTLLQWVQGCTSKFGVEVHDFGKSWRSGLAFLALIKSIDPVLVDLRDSLTREPNGNLSAAFTIAHHSLDIPPLLEPGDVLSTSPDEQSIITYVSMFLWHCIDTDEICKADIGVPEIPHFGSLDSVSFGETPADGPEAQALLKGFGRSSEQLLWKRWARGSSGSPRSTSLHSALPPDRSSSCGDIFSFCRSQSTAEQPAAIVSSSPFTKKRSRCRSALRPPSPLDAGGVSQEIRSWMEKASADQGHGKPRADERQLSLSSEEGIYSLSALDSDEEEAYSYILDLNKEVFPPYNQQRRQVPRVEEETAEEMILNGQLIEESKHLEVCETLNGNGSKHQGGSEPQRLDSEVRTQLMVDRKFDLDTNNISLDETADIKAVFDTEPEGDNRRKERREEERPERGQSNEDGDYCEEERKKAKMENAGLVTHGCDTAETPADETKTAKRFEVTESETELFEKRRQAREKSVEEEEEDNLTTLEKGQDERLLTEREEGENVQKDEKEHIVDTEHTKTENGKKVIIDKVRGAEATGTNRERENYKDIAPKMEDSSVKDNKHRNEVKNWIKFEATEEKVGEYGIKRRKVTDNGATTTTDHLSQTSPRNVTNGGWTSWTPACRVTSESSSREEGFCLQSLAASCDITPLELKTLVVLWILLYCCFILLQMNL